MLLNKHKNYVFIGMTALGLLLTVAMTIVGVSINFFGDGIITPNRFSSYGVVNAKSVSAPASSGMKSENISFEFEEPKASASRSINDNAFVSLGSALTDANAKEPTIFNVHGVSQGNSPKGNLEFLFESLSPSDYKSKVFFQAFTPFTRLANTSGFSDVKYLSTINPDGARHVAISTTASNDTITGKESEDLWRNMLLVLSPMSENTSYDLTLTLAKGITIHGNLSTESEQKQMMEYDPNNNVESVFAVKAYSGVKNIDLYLQGKNNSDNTVALTVIKPASTPDYVKSLTDFAANRGNQFPRNFTTTVTVENEATPAYVFYPEK